MSDLISRQAAIDAFCDMPCKYDEDGYALIYRCDAADRINVLPTIQLAEPKRGRWISADAMFHGVPFYCSECGENTRDTVMGKPRWKFCPNCGADMRGEQDE